MTDEPSWKNDPYGRYELRYWDGARWTEHVSTGGAQSVDPLGDTTVIPFATPASALPPPATGSTLTRFLDSLGPDGRARPVPRLSLALAGAGGAVAASGVLAAILGDSGSRGRAFGAALVILAVALALRVFVQGQPDLAAAAVGAGVVGLFTLGGAIVAGNDSAAWSALVIALLFVAAWALPGFRGRPLMLGIGTVLLVSALGIASSSGDEPGGLLDDVPFDNPIGGQPVVFLFAAGALLGLVWWLDRAGYHGVATSLVVAALISAFIGVAQSASDLDDAAAAILIVAVGLGVCAVGSHGDRRATTWWGALLTTIGVIALFATVMTPDSISGAAGLLFVSGLLLIGGPAAFRAIRARQSSAGAAPSTGSLPPPTM